MIKRLIISGRVQGVFFRESMLRKAVESEVTGWVRNRRDGTVEAMISGEEAAVSLIIAWAKHGPDMASVTNVEVNEGEGNYNGFEKRETL